MKTKDLPSRQLRLRRHFESAGSALQSGKIKNSDLENKGLSGSDRENKGLTGDIVKIKELAPKARKRVTKPMVVSTQSSLQPAAAK